MLWTDKTTINEFLKDNPQNQELYKTYLKLKGDSLSSPLMQSRYLMRYTTS